MSISNLVKSSASRKIIIQYPGMIFSCNHRARLSAIILGEIFEEFDGLDRELEVFVQTTSKPLIRNYHGFHKITFCTPKPMCLELQPSLPIDPQRQYEIIIRTPSILSICRYKYKNEVALTDGTIVKCHMSGGLITGLKLNILPQSNEH